MGYKKRSRAPAKRIKQDDEDYNVSGEDVYEDLSTFDGEEVAQEDGDVPSTSGRGDAATHQAAKPKHPRTAWIVFLTEFTRKENQKVKSAASGSSFNLAAASRMASERWTRMTNEEKAAYENIAADDRRMYHSTRPPRMQNKSATATISTRCSPKAFFQTVKSLSEDQRKAVVELGFGGLLHLSCTELPRQLCRWLVEHIDTTHCRLVIAPHQIYDITPADVEMVMGIPSSGSDVPTTAPKEQLDLIRMDYQAQKTGVSFTALRQDFTRGDSGERFRRSFVLYALGILLCTTMKSEASPKLFPAVVDMEAIPRYNWSKFVLQWLLKEVKCFQDGISGRLAASPCTKKGQNVWGNKSGMGGCLIFLMLFYFDRASSDLATIPRETPRLKGWNDELVAKRLTEESKFLCIKDNGDITGSAVPIFTLADLPADVDPTDPAIVEALQGVRDAQKKMNAVISNAVRRAVSDYTGSRRSNFPSQSGPLTRGQSETETHPAASARPSSAIIPACANDTSPVI